MSKMVESVVADNASESNSENPTWTVSMSNDDEESRTEKLCVLEDDDLDVSDPTSLVDRLIKMKYAAYVQACPDKDKVEYFDADTLFGKICRVHGFPSEAEYRAIITADSEADIEKMFDPSKGPTKRISFFSHSRDARS